MLWGWSILSLGWILLAASLATLLLALQGPAQTLSIGSPSLWAASMAAISLSMVAGFLSLLPGGAGVRELVVSLILQPLVGPVTALLAALGIRVTHRAHLAGNWRDPCPLLPNLLAGYALYDLTRA